MLETYILPLSFISNVNLSFSPVSDNRPVIFLFLCFTFKSFTVLSEVIIDILAIIHQFTKKNLGKQLHTLQTDPYTVIHKVKI